MKIVNQGRPQSSCFTVIQPSPGNIKKGDTVQCVDPKTNRSTNGICIDFWTFDWYNVPDAFIMLAFGVDAQSLKTALEAAKPEFNGVEDIRLFLIQETK
jgi:hypothetical protein